MNTGKRIRLSRWLFQGRSFVLAVDQMIPRGIKPQLLGEMSRWTRGPWDALVVHPGTVGIFARDFAGGVPFILKLTSNSRCCEDATRRGRVASVEQGVALGASGVAINLFIGSRYEAKQLEQLCDAAECCERWGMPLMVFANPADSKQQFDAPQLAYACRVAAELGADVVKTDYPGDAESFSQVVRACPVPLLVEESPLPENTGGTLETVRGAIAAGGAGVLLGQRVWGAEDPHSLGHQIARRVHG